MSFQFDWAEPPAQKKIGGSKPGHTARQRELDQFAALLRRNPGRFALVGQQDAAGQGASFRRRGLVVVTRKRPDGRYDMYVKAPEHEPE